ncbi:MAG TPA: hypothetical protein VK177_01790 [Flavobacteriales bacterium]|nr:hypothetical protein [Flavobacteriales bacterium]
MNRFLSLLLVLAALEASAQHSPYFYRAANPEVSIEGNLHAHYLNRFFFRPYDEDDRDEKLAKNVVSKNAAHEFTEFNVNGRIYFTAYLENPLKFYYDRYLADPKRKKADWDYTPNWDEKDLTYYASHPGFDQTSKVLGAFVYVVKVDGVKAGAFYFVMAKTDFSKRLDFTNLIWAVDTDVRWGDDDQKREPNAKEKYAAMADKDEYYPLYYYMRDNAKPGKHKVEVEIYPCSLLAKTTADHSGELVCKGEFSLIVTEKDIKEMKEAGGPKNQEEVTMYRHPKTGFFTKG